LTAEPARLIAYRVQLRNAAGRTAGATPAVFASSGPAPHAVEELRGRATRAGVVLEWRPEAGGTEAVELNRSILQPPTATTTETSTATATTAGSGTAHRAGLPGAAREPLESRFRAGTAGSSAVDAGGTVDRTAQIDHSYRYTAERVRSVELSGQRLEVRSVASAEVTVEMKDVFPPEAPLGLVAVPGYAGEAEVQFGEQAQRAVIDLSWEPNLEPRLATSQLGACDDGGLSRPECSGGPEVCLPCDGGRCNRQRVCAERGGCGDGSGAVIRGLPNESRCPFALSFLFLLPLPLPSPLAVDWA